jgi:hypothetical protein
MHKKVFLLLRAARKLLGNYLVENSIRKFNGENGLA